MIGIAASFIAMVLLCGNGLFAGDKYIQYDLDKLHKKSEQRLKEIDKKLEVIEKEEKARQKFDEVNLLYEQAERLYNELKFEEAKKLYRKIVGYVKDPDITAVAKKRKKELEVLEKQKRKEDKRSQKELAKLENQKIKDGKKTKPEALKEENKKQKALDRIAKQAKEEEKIRIREIEKERLEKERVPKAELDRKREEQKKKWEQDAAERKRLRNEEIARRKAEEKKQLKIVKDYKENVNVSNAIISATPQLDSLYKEGVRLYNNNQFVQARDVFSKVLSSDPGYERAKTYLKFNIPNKLKQIEIVRQYEQERKLREKIQCLIKEGKDLYQSKKYAEATVKFKEVSKLDSKNQDALIYLKLISQK